VKQKWIWTSAALLTLVSMSGLGYVMAQSSLSGSSAASAPAPMDTLPGMPGMDPAKQVRATSSTPLKTTLPQLRADLTLELARPYTPNVKLADDYRCFVLDPKLERDTFISGYEVVPGNGKVVHHAILNVATPEQQAEIAGLDGKDGQEGWSCFGGTGLRSGTQLDGGKALLTILRNGGLNKAALEELIQNTGMGGGGLGIGSWTPGSTATLFPEGTGRLVPKGSTLVIQVHYNTLAGIEPDRTKVRLQLERTAALKPLNTFVMAAPVELPCPTPSTGTQCGRSSAVQAGADKYGSRAGKLPDYLLTFCDKKISDFSGQNPARVVSTCERTLNKDLTAEGVILHMHTRGVSTSLERNPGTKQAQTLLEIPQWDFHWQGSYWYQEPIALKKGDVIRITCVWDNTQGDKPRYVTWGEGTQDEMCLGSLSVLE